MNALLESPAWLLTGYCVLAFLAAWVGGELPGLLKLTHTRLQVAISFVAGLMLGLAMLGLLPHATDALASPEKAGTWAMGGFLLMFLLQRFLPFHHHDVVEGNPLEPCGHSHSLAERSARNLSWVGVALGLSLHSVFDGLAMAAATATGEYGHGGLLGLGTALAVILHKPFGALAIATLMAAQATAPALRRRVILAFASVTPLGALAFYLGAGPWAHVHPAWLGYALAFCSGTFLCIACADLLPELQFHSHDRLKLTAALLTGIGVALLVTRLGHEHPAHDPATAGPPGNRAELSMDLSVAAIARVETGSLTPTLSRGGRVSHIPHGDMPELQPSEPSRPVPATTRPNPSKAARNILPLPPGEGRGEGRSLHSSLHGSWSPCVSNFWKTCLSMNLPSPRHRTPTPHRNPPASPGSWPVSMAPAPTPLPMHRASVAAGVSPAVEGGVSPPGIPGSWTVGSSISNRAIPMDQALHERQQHT